MMRPEDVPDEWVEKAAQAMYDANPYRLGIWVDVMQDFLLAARDGLAAVMPEIQAQVRRANAMTYMITDDEDELSPSAMVTCTYDEALALLDRIGEFYSLVEVPRVLPEATESEVRAASFRVSPVRFTDWAGGECNNCDSTKYIDPAEGLCPTCLHTTEEPTT